MKVGFVQRLRVSRAMDCSTPDAATKHQPAQSLSPGSLRMSRYCLDAPSLPNATFGAAVLLFVALGVACCGATMNSGSFPRPCSCPTTGETGVSVSFRYRSFDLRPHTATAQPRPDTPRKQAPVRDRRRWHAVKRQDSLRSRTSRGLLSGRGPIDPSGYHRFPPSFPFTTTLPLPGVPVRPEEMADRDDQDPQKIADKLEAGLEVTDEALAQMDVGKFRDWMNHMIDGISCLAHDSLEAKACADREMDESRSAFNSHDLLRDLREDRRKEWHAQWRTGTIQARMAEEHLFRFRPKANFEYLKNLFLSLEWFLVSAGTQRFLIQQANGDFS